MIRSSLRTATLSAVLAAGAPARADWPMWLGPGFTGVHPGALPSASTTPRFSPPAKAWTGQAAFGGTRAEVPDGRRAAQEECFDIPHHAGEGSPIAADGKVFFGHYRPGGEVYDKYIAHHRLEMTQEQLRAQKRGPVDGQVLKHERWLVGATDVLTALDAETGRTLWETELGHRGLNINIGNKGGYGVTPAYDDGKVFFLGTGGHLYGVDAADGSLLWTSDIGGRTRMQRYYRHMAESGATYAPRFRSTFLTAVTAFRGVVLVSDEIHHRVSLGMGTDYHYDRSNGVAAFDAQTGRKLWHHTDKGLHTPPIPWEHRGKPFALVAGNRGTSLFDLRTGREIWHHPEAAHHRNGNFGPAVSDDYLVVIEDDSRHPVAYRIGPKGLVRLWRLEHSPRGNVLIVGDRGYLSTSRRLLAVDMATGRIVAEREYRGASTVSGNPYLLAAGDWILAPSTGKGPRGIRFFPRHPEAFARPPGLLEVDFSKGYEISILPAIDDRRLYVRVPFRIEAFPLP